MRKIAALMILALAVGLGGCGKEPMVVEEPAMALGPDGKLIPITDAKGNQLYKKTTVPGDAVPAWAQSEMAKQRKPYIEQKIEDGKIVAQTIWGENGRAQYQDVDSDGVKYAKALVGPGAAVAVAGISGYYGWKNNETLWTGLGNYMNRGGGPQTVTVGDGAVYNSGAVSGTLSTQFSIDDHSAPIMMPATQ